METRVNTIRRWLMTGVKPANIEVTNGNNEIKRVSFGFGDTWIGVARTIDAFDPIRLVAYDIENIILRATLMTSLLEIDPEDTAGEIAGGNAQRGPLSTNEQLLITYGQLLAKAYENSSQVAWNTAFSKMVEIVEIFQNQSQATEARLARVEALFQKTVASQLAPQNDEPDLLQTMVGAYMQGAAASATATGTSKPPTNGKGAAQILQIGRAHV